MTEEYPTEQELQKIKEWEPGDLHGLMQFVKSLWAFRAWGFSQDDEIYFISTGGWSGNEDIIEAMMSNVVWWMMYWQQSRRGGHYIFAPLTFATIEKLEKLNHA